MPTTLIFGASRGLGRAFTEQALQQGQRVIALIRSPEVTTELRALGVEVVSGDALDPQAVAAACQLAAVGSAPVTTTTCSRRGSRADEQ